MWRTRSFIEAWERRKTYLIRSLFEDVPFLSPIQEEAEPKSSSSDDEFRAESPLPDLIIEVEPKKPNRHDEESEEFYERLAKEMRRLYKRDHNIDSSTASSSSLESFEKHEFEQRFNSPFKNGYSDSEDIEDITSIREPEMPSRSELLLSNQTMQRNFNEEEFQGNSSSSSTTPRDNSCSQQVITHAEVHTHVEDGDVSCGGESEGLAETSDASRRNTASSELSSHFSTELMRRVQDFASFGSLPRYERSTSDSENVISEKDFSLEVQPMELSEEIISYPGFGEITHEASSDLSNFLSTSTPVSKRKSQIVRKKFRRRLDPYTAHSSSTSRRDVGGADATTQTSFSDDEPDWSTFWNNFFVGNPSVYTLCSCRNHVCS